MGISTSAGDSPPGRGARPLTFAPFPRAGSWRRRGRPFYSRGDTLVDLQMLAIILNDVSVVLVEQTGLLSVVSAEGKESLQG